MSATRFKFTRRRGILNVNQVKVDPRLLKPFNTEPNGPDKGDICRIAALYLFGGYYFDVDIQVIKTLDPEPEVDFITTNMVNKKFFQVILALPASHPVAKATLASMVHDWYLNLQLMAMFNVTGFDATVFNSKAYTKARMDHLGQFFNIQDEIGILLGPATLRLGYNQHKDSTTGWFLEEVENGKVQIYP
jgi:hypothetical protein